VLIGEICGQVTAAVPYPGGFPELGPPLVHSQGVDYRFKEAYSAAKMIMEGARMLLCTLLMVYVVESPSMEGCTCDFQSSTVVLQSRMPQEGTI
jgi:hypothetical protein